MMLSSVDLPQPDDAEQAHELAGADVHVDAVERATTLRCGDADAVDDELVRLDVDRRRHGGHGRGPPGRPSQRSQRRRRSLTSPMTPNTISRANIVSTARNRWARTIRKARPSCGGQQLGDDEHQPGGGEVDAGDVDDPGHASAAGSPGAASSTGRRRAWPTR